MESHLLQMRGLKLLVLISAKSVLLSHLLQMRGLKPKNEFGYETLRKSHLLQMRGLKLIKFWVRYILIGRIFYRCVD